VCMGHTWYLANDMQFHILAPILLLSLWSFAVLAFGLGFGLIAMSCFLYGWYTVQDNFPPNAVETLDAYVYNSNGIEFFRNIYFKPYTRCGPYVIGIFHGYALHKFDGKKLKIPKLLNLSIWLFATAISLAVLYGLYNVSVGHPLTNTVNGIYSGLNRSVWSIGVGWVIFACVTGNGGFINKFLCWNVLKPFSRLTYCAYLIHPLVLQLCYDGKDEALHFDSHYTMVYYFLAHLVIAYSCSFVLSLAFESPILGIEKIFLPRHTDKRKSTPTTQNLNNNTKSLSISIPSDPSSAKSSGSDTIPYDSSNGNTNNSKNEFHNLNNGNVNGIQK